MSDVPAIPESNESPDEPLWETDDTTLHVVRVNRYDEKDVLIGRLHIVIIEDEEADGDDAYISSTVSSPVETR